MGRGLTRGVRGLRAARRPRSGPVCPPERLEPRQVLSALGLTGHYFDDLDFGVLKSTRIDPVIDFNWNVSSPAPGVIPTTYSVRWTGAVVAAFSERYTFTLTADDGVRLWVNDELIVNHWGPGIAGTVSGQIALPAGRETPIKLEYFQGFGPASVRLEWSSQSTPRQVVPAENLRATAPVDQLGMALQETWLGVAGTTVGQLTSSPAYSGPPAYRQMLTSLESLKPDAVESAGSRVRGFIVPSFTGPHVFHVAGRDDVRLSLSPSDDPSAATIVAFTSGATAPYAWHDTPSQASQPVDLVQGRRYYFEVLHKAGIGVEHWAVGWTTPASGAVRVVGASNIEPWGSTATLPATGILTGMSTGRDRILTSPEMWSRAEALVAQGGQFATWYASIKARGDFYLTADLPPTVAPSGAAGGTQPVLAALENQLTYLAGAYRMVSLVEGNTANALKYFEKAKAIILNVIQWNTWDTGSQFLGAAMVSQGISVCYDWMYDAFTAAERKQIADRLYTLAIKPTIDVCTARTYWTQWYGNWAFVCIGGVGSAALAIAPEHYRAEAETLLAVGWPVLQSSMRHFAGENGGWHEGPGYLGYGTLYLIRLMSNLQSAVGTDYGLSNETGFAQVANYLLHVSTNVGGNSNGTFPFGNGDWSQNGDPWFYWLAARFDRPDVSRVVRERADSRSTATIVSGGTTRSQSVASFQSPWALLWYDPRGDQPALMQSPGAAVQRTDAGFYGDPRLLQWGTHGRPNHSEHVNIWRDSWTNPSTTLMFKGTYQGVDAHDDLDGGSFILDALGTRWAGHLPNDSYSLPRVGGTPYGPYGRRAEGQNTLVINPTANDYLSSADANERALNADQVYKDEAGRLAAAEVIKSLATDLESVAVVDLSNLYAKMRVSSVLRGFRLDRRDGSVLVQDEIKAAVGPDIHWFMHVPVAFASWRNHIQISADGRTATITIGSNRLECRILAGTGARFVVKEAAPLPSSPDVPGQRQYTGFSKLTINYTGTRDERLAVWMVPLKSGQSAPAVAPEIRPLAEWRPAGVQEVWAGDIDNYASVSPADMAAATEVWTQQIVTATGRQPKALDDTASGRVVPVTLDLPLGPGEQVTWAKLVVGLKSGGPSSGDRFHFESTNGVPLSLIGWSGVDAAATSRELVLSSSQLTQLQDGRVNLAFSGNVSVDWVQLQYTSIQTGVVHVPAGEWLVDSTVRAGSTPLVKRGPGTLVLTVAGEFSGGTVVEEGAVVVRHPSALGSGPLTIRAGGVVGLDVGRATVPVSGLVLDPAGRLDLGTGRLEVAPGGFDPAAVRQALAVGRNGGSWNGVAGIVSSEAPGAPWAVGNAISQGSLVLAWAAMGDANLDGRVDTADLNAILTGGLLNSGATTGDWQRGDFDYDGRVTTADVNAMLSTGLLNTGSYAPPTLLATGSPSGDTTAGDTLTSETAEPLAIAWFAVEQEARAATARTKKPRA